MATDLAGLKKAYARVKDVASGKTLSDNRSFPELCVLCAEQALRVNCKEIAEDCLTIFLESDQSQTQPELLCRAYLCQAQLNFSLTASVEDIDKAVTLYLKAIEISKENESHFLVFNASVLYFRTVRPLLRPGRRRHLVPSLTQVVSALEEVCQKDYAWRAELMLLLVECLLDAGDKKEAAAFAKVTSDFIELNKPELLPRILTLQAQHNLVEALEIPKNASPKLLVIYKILTLKHCRLQTSLTAESEGKTESDRLREIFLLLTQSFQDQSSDPSSSSSSPDGSSSSIPMANRIELLLELAFLSLQLKEHVIAEDCLRELNTSDSSTVGQQIMMECVECEVSLRKQKGSIEDYTKSIVEAQQAVVGRLEALLQRAVGEGDDRVTQCVCAALWNSCLPLLQNNLRKSIKSPLITLANTLEKINSTLLEVQCLVYAELAAIEVDEERLEAAVRHLHAALALDDQDKYREHLSFSLHLLQLRTKIYSPHTRQEDQAAVFIQQAKECSESGPAKKCRSLLISAGMALAPDTFQMVLDADSAARVSGSRSQILTDQFAAKARHYVHCVQKVEDHLARLETGTDERERLRLWVSLVKAARKQEAWDVCRAACRFCLLYDDGRWENTTIQVSEGSPAESKQGDEGTGAEGLIQGGTRELLRLLAEVHFINAEVTVQKLRSEGVELNGSPVPPVKMGPSLPEDSLDWALYSDWISGLSAYATANFLRGAEIGAGLEEEWMVVNAAVYLWNYNSHVLATGGHHTLLPTFTRLLELLRKTGHAGEVVLLILLCNTVAQGLIQHWVEVSRQASQERQEKEKQPQPEKPRKGGGKTAEKPAATHGLLEAAAVQDVKKALELCGYALQLSSGNSEKVPMVVRKQVISTWVKTKCLLQQQIGPKLDPDEEITNEAEAAMCRVLIGVEMLLCNSKPGLMEFTVPSLATLVGMASDCKWTDPVMELFVWSQLSHFAHQSSDHELVMTCTQNALQQEQTALHKAKVTACSLYSVISVNEMLSMVACWRGLCMLSKHSGHTGSYLAALGMIQSGISYGEQAGSWSLCSTAAWYYWNACQPFLDSPEQRQQLKEPLQLILKALTNTYPKSGTERSEVVENQEEPQTGTVTSALGTEVTHSVAKAQDDLAMRAAMYNVLFHTYADSGKWRSGLKVLEQAIREMPRTHHRLLLYKQCVLVKARLGESVGFDMQRCRDEGELPCALMWQRVALLAKDTQQGLTYYQNAISSLESPDYQLQKVDLLLEFGQWLYCNHFTISDAQQQLQGALEILIGPGTDTRGPLFGETTGPCPSQLSVPVSSSALDPSELRDVRRLDCLLRAYALLSLMELRVSPQHQQYLSIAYRVVLKIWQVSLDTAHEIIRKDLKSPDVTAAPASATGTKKDKEKEKDKDKDIDKDKDKDKEKEKSKKPKEPPPLVKKFTRGDGSSPSSTEWWSRFACPEEHREAFKRDSSPHCINTRNISMQNWTLYCLDLLVRELESVSLTPLTLPLLHLAEVIAHDLSLSRSHSDLYRLKIVKTCCDLGLEASSPYREALLSFSCIPEEEQMICRKEVAFQRDRDGSQTRWKNTKADKMVSPRSGGAAAEDTLSRRRPDWYTVQELWLDKAAVCLSVGLYQPARRLLAEAHMVAKELGEQALLAKTLYLLAVLAGHEQHYGQAVQLLEQAQEFGGDGEFWYNLTQSLLKCTAEGGEGDTYTKLCGITERVVGFLTSALEQRPNRVPILHYYTASLQATGAVLCRAALKSAHTGQVVDAETLERLKMVCDVLEHSMATLLQHGYKSSAAEASMEQAITLRMLAMFSSVKEEKHECLLSALTLMQQALVLQEEVLTSHLSLLSPQESGRYRLPAMQVCMHYRLALADLAALMMQIQYEEEKQYEKVHGRRSFMDRLLMDYLRSSEDQTKDWATVVQSLGQTALTQLSVVHSLSTDCVETRARSLGMMGRCLRLLALQRDPYQTTTQWDGPVMVESSEAAEEKEKDDEEEDGSKGTEESTTLRRESTTLRRESTSRSATQQTGRGGVQPILSQAIENLNQALSLALEKNLPQLLSQVCVDLLEWHGQNNPVAAGQYLALLQSCLCCAEVSRLLGMICPNTSQSQLAALLGLQKNLQSSMQHGSRQLSAVDRSLQSLSKAYQHVTVSPKHLSFLDDMPPTLKIILLQHSEDSSVLYGAFFEKKKASESHRGKSSTGGLVCSRVAKAQVQPSDLLRLRGQAQAFRHLAVRTLLKECRQLGNAMQDDGLLSHTHKDNTDRELEVHFRAIVEGMEDYLRPVLSQLNLCLSQRPSSISIGKAGRPKDKEERGMADKVQPEHGESVVVLADSMLLELPLEALTVLQGDGISSLSRDFSLQVLHARLPTHEPAESDNKKETKGGKATKGKADQGKAIKVEPVKNILPPHSVPVDIHNFKYIVDPHNDWGNNELSNPAETMKNTLETHAKVFSALWEGVIGNDHAYSPAKLEDLLEDCSSLIFCGSERLLKHVPPTRLITLNMTECQMAILFDLAQNDTSMRRQSLHNGPKRKGQLTLEAPLECVYLLTFCGVQCVMLNQWATSTRTTAHNMDAFMENLLDTGLPSGQAVHTLRMSATQIPETDEDPLEEAACPVDVAVAPHWSSPSALNFIIYGLPNLVAT